MTDKRNTIFVVAIASCLLQSCSEPANLSEIPEQAFIETARKQQNFDLLQIDHAPQWQLDTAENVGPYSEGGEFFSEQGVIAPVAKRGTYRVDENFQIEIYTRETKPLIFDYIDIIPDPQDPDDQVLKIMTPKHTDAVYLRSSQALPSHYQISFRVGYINYGDASELNGYDIGNETGEPWVDMSAVGHNGFYWLAILDTEPQPHNNIWMHHHRKFVIDSWNRDSHRNSFNVIALDGLSPTHHRFGKQFISYVDGEFTRIQDRPSGYYLPEQWYQVTFERTPTSYSFSINGQFADGQERTYQGTINTQEECVFHYNQTPAELSDKCIDSTGPRLAGSVFPNWPAGSAFPDYFIIGEPHINYYEGSVLIDDIEVIDKTPQ